MMRRRELIAATWIAAVTSGLVLPWAAPCAQGRPHYRVGILFPGKLGARRLELVRQGMDAVLGELRGTVTIDTRSAESDADLLKAFPVEYAAATPPVDVILAIASLAL